MNTNERKYSNMYVQTENFLKGNEDKWSEIVGLKRSIGQFSTLLADVLHKDADTSTTTVGVTREKNELKDLVVLKATILFGTVYAYASEVNDGSLMTEMDLRPSDLKKMAEREMVQLLKGRLERVRNIWNAENAEDVEGLPEAAENATVAKLADQGITEAQIVEMENLTDELGEQIGISRTVSIRNSVKSSEVEQLLKEIHKLVTNQIDRNMLRFQISDPSFYEGYQRARKLVDNG